MELLNTLAKLSASPIVQFFVLITIGAAVKIAKPKSKRVDFLSTCIHSCAVLWLFLCSQPMFSNWLIAPLEQYSPIVKESNSKLENSDQILVLACYHVTQEQLPDVSRWPPCAMQRLIQAKLLNKKWNLPIVLTGGYFLKNHKASYAKEAADFLVSQGVARSQIKIVPKGENTLTELTAAFPEKNKSTIIISSASHMTRVEYYLNYLDIKQYLLVPVDHLQKEKPRFILRLPRISSLIRAERAIYEYFALAELSLSNNTSLRTKTHQ